MWRSASNVTNRLQVENINVLNADAVAAPKLGHKNKQSLRSSLSTCSVKKDSKTQHFLIDETSSSSTDVILIAPTFPLKLEAFARDLGVGVELKAFSGLLWSNVVIILFYL